MPDGFNQFFTFRWWQRLDFNQDLLGSHMLSTITPNAPALQAGSSSLCVLSALCGKISSRRFPLHFHTNPVRIPPSGDYDERRIHMNTNKPKKRKSLWERLFSPSRTGYDADGDPGVCLDGSATSSTTSEGHSPSSHHGHHSHDSGGGHSHSCGSHHSCGGGHSCGGHGCGGHGCGGGH